jgi:hypothetical protein
MMRLFSTLLIALIGLASAFGQKAALRSASRVEMPALADCNSPAFWKDGAIHVFNSAGVPMGSTGPDQFHLGQATAAGLDTPKDYSVWIESTWQDPDSNIFAWYHHEPGGLCGGKLTAPQIGALVSSDGGRTFRNLGIVLESGDPIDCTAANGFFGSGHGDFSVIADRDAKYLYFLFGNYGGSPAGQGVAIARMAAGDRWDPAGAVWKYFEGAWTEPGLGGRVSPIFPAAVSWQRPDTNAFWGPSVHWNTYLEQYVVLLNHSCCRPRWPQEGIYVTFNKDIADPAGWSTPEKIMSRPPDYYPQVVGLEEGGTDTVAGQTARFYIHGRSSWEIVFSLPAPDPPPQPEAPAAEAAPALPATPKAAAPLLLSIGSPAEYLLTVGAAPPEGGSVAVSPAMEKKYYPQGSSVQIMATPNAGYRFVDWSGGLAGEANPQTAVLNAPLNITANFVPLSSELRVTVAHEGDFKQGQPATYLVTVSNQPGAGETRGAITVKEALPEGLVLASMEGTGWICAESECSRSDALPRGTAFPPITVKVNVEDTAGSPLVNRVSVSGGGAAAASGADAANVLARRVPNQ